jgi:hypothetical protein
VSAIEKAIPVGARQLGVRVAPQLRLAMGYRDEERKGAPVKTDYLIPKRGAQGEYGRQADKFTEVYGEKPKSVDILLPPSLQHALTIQYKAWGGGGDDEGGGVLKAIGHTNFALEDFVGGPDMLTVWNPDGTVVEVETMGLDANSGEPLDAVARELQLDLYTTFRFMLPKVLGFGSFAEITSKGKKTTDNLWSKLLFYYGLFGSKVTFAIEPQLVIRPATARPVVKKDGESKRIKSSIYVLDLVLPESMDASLERLRERQELIAGGGGAAAMLYGPQENGETKALEAPQPLEEDSRAAAEESPSATNAGGGTGAEAAPDEPFTGEEPGSKESPFKPPAGAKVAESPGSMEITFGRHQGRTIESVYGDDTADPANKTTGIGYVTWLAGESVKDEKIRLAAQAFVKGLA